MPIRMYMYYIYIYIGFELQLAITKSDNPRPGQKDRPQTTEAKAKRKRRNNNKQAIKNAREQQTSGVAAPAERLTTSIPPPEGLTNRAGRTQPKHTDPKLSRHS